MGRAMMGSPVPVVCTPRTPREPGNQCSPVPCGSRELGNLGTDSEVASSVVDVSPNPRKSPTTDDTVPGDAHRDIKPANVPPDADRARDGGPRWKPRRRGRVFDLPRAPPIEPKTASRFVAFEAFQRVIDVVVAVTAPSPAPVSSLEHAMAICDLRPKPAQDALSRWSGPMLVLEAERLTQANPGARRPHLRGTQ